MMNNPPIPPNEDAPYTMLIRQDWDRWYPRYLESDAWMELRLKVFERANWRCEQCKAPATEVHHLTYIHVGNEAMEDLQALCRQCHKRQHRRINEVQMD